MRDVTYAREALFGGAQYKDVELVRRSGDKARFRLELMTPDQSAQVQALEMAVYESLDDKRLYSGLLDLEETRQVITDGIVIGVFYEGDLVGATMLVVGSDAPANLAKELDDSTDCVTFSSSIVLPGYRGWGLQAQFNKLREKAAKAMGARIAAMSISPHNKFSLNNAIKSGFEIAKLVKLYEDLDRYILVKHLSPQ